MGFVWILVGTLLAIVLYLIHLNRSMSGAPEEALKLAGERWTPEEVREAYNKFTSNPRDFRKLLPPKTGRRYIVVGGSGLVGGWIVQHLLERGEDARAIRIADIAPPRRPVIVESKVQFQKTDVSDKNSIDQAFRKPWPSKHASAPLTVFHTAAYINASYRTHDFFQKYQAVNVQGTRDILAAAKAAGCSVFVATSSSSICLRPFSYLVWPWQKHAARFFQVYDNAEPAKLEGSLTDFSGCYAYSKVRAENLVRAADSKKDGFRTGAIRPGHAIYGHGGENLMSIAYDYLRRGKCPTWIGGMLTQFVSAQNVSLAHLQFESRLTSPTSGADIGGNAYAITDPGPPVLYKDFYTTLSTLSVTPTEFPPVAPLPFFFICHIVEAYILFRHRHARFLPAMKGDLERLQPGLLHVCTLNTIYGTEKAREELGYSTDLGTLEGLCLQLKEWNDAAESKRQTLVS